MSREEKYENDDHYYLQVWDESGNALLRNGTGICFITNGDHGNYFDIVDQKLRSSFSIDEESSDTTYVVTEQSAEYKGGFEGFYQNIGKTIKYPTAAKRAGVEGKVFVEFIIEKNGTVSHLNVLKGIGAGCDEETLRVIALQKQWTPGRVNGKAVRQKMVLPINFKLG